MTESNTLSIKILNKHYKVKCDPENVASLEKSAAYLNQEMLSLKSSGAVTNTDSVAVVAALNIAHTLTEIKDAQNQSIKDITKKINIFNGKMQKKDAK